MRVGRPGGGFDLRRAGARHAKSDVAGDAVVKQHGVLRHHADLRAQRRQRHIAQVVPVDGDVSAGHVIEPREQVDQGGLPGTARPDDRHHLTGANAEAHAAECVPAALVLVAEPHVA